MRTFDELVSASDLLDQPLYTRALLVAGWAHCDQRRKFAARGVEYIRHPVAVAAQLDALGADEDVLVAALLHDTVEDTVVTAQDLERAFGAGIRSVVEELTNPPGLVKSARVTYFREKIPRLSLPALQVKLADRLHNLSDIDGAPEDFQVRYLAEARAMADAVPPERTGHDVVQALRAALLAVVERGTSASGSDCGAV